MLIGFLIALTAPLKSQTANGWSSSIPFAFEENDGQFYTDVSYLARSQNYSVAILHNGLSFELPGAGHDSVVGIRFAGSHGGTPVSLSGVAYRSNYFIGADRSQWREGVPNFQRVGIRTIYPGIDTEFYQKNGDLEHDFILSPGADPSIIHLSLRSARRPALTSDGDVVIPAHEGEVRFRKPVAFQFDADGNRVIISTAYKLKGNQLSFVLGQYDRSRTLVIDPVILFATYVSGTAGSTPAQMTTDGTGTLFLTGTTTTANGFPSGAAGAKNPGSGSSLIFVAAMKSSQLGSVLQWISYLGNGGTSTATSVAYSAASSGIVYVGGTTSAGSFPGAGGTTFGGAFPTGSGSVSGIISGLKSADGTLKGSTYVSTSGPSATVTDTTAITGLAADVSGNVYISGYGLGIGLPLTAELGGTAGANRIFPTNTGTLNNAFVLVLKPDLTTSVLATYLQSNLAGDYRANAIQLDSNANIYVAGTVGGASSVAFPSAQSFTSAGTYTAGSDFSPCSRTATNTSAFLAQIQPPTGSATNSILGYALFTCADTTAGSETASNVSIGQNELYLVGNTISADLASGVYYTTSTSTSPALASFTGGLQTAIAGSQTNGYIISVPLSSTAPQVGIPSAFTFLGGSSGATSLSSAAVDTSSGLLHVAGSTNAKGTDLPAATGSLPSGQDTTTGQAAGTTRGLLYTLNPDLTTARSVANFGSSVSTSSKVVSVQSDEAGDAFVLVNDTLSATAGAASFVSGSATQAVPAVNKDNAYVAEVLGTAAAASTPGLSFTVASESPSIDGTACSGATCVIGYDPSDSSNISTVKYSWNLSTSADASNVVLNFTPELMLSSYSLEEDGNPMNGCIAATSATAPSNGVTCLIPSLIAGSSHSITLTASASANASPSATPNPIGTSFALAGTAADAEAEYQSASQTSVSVANPVSLTLGFTQSVSTVDAANGASDTGSTGHTTQVVYTAVVTNTGNYDSPNTVLVITPPTDAAYHIVSVTSSINTGCDMVNGTGCTTVAIPKGTALTYKITAEYLAAGYGTSTPGPASEQIKASAYALPRTPKSAPSDITLTTDVNGYAALAVSFTEPTYPSGQTAFNLNSGTLTYKVTLTNNGPNASSAFTLTNTVPAGFTVTSASCVPTGADLASCDTKAGGGFGITSINAAGTVVYTFTGSFPDKGTAADAVPQNAANATVKDSVTLSAPAGTYDPNALTAQSTGVVVQRSVHLKLSLTTTTTSLSGTGYTAPAYNLGTQINYVYTINNSGPNIAVAVPLTAALTPPAGYMPPAGYVTVTAPSTGVTCAPDYTSCTVASVPSGSTQLTFIVTYPDKAPPANVYPAPAAISAVPTNTSSAAYKYGITLPVTYYVQGGGSNPIAVDSNPAGTTAGDNSNAYSVNIYRTVHLKLALANSGTAATGGSYVQPAYNLGTGVTYTYTIQNTGPNYALNVPLTSLLSPPAGYTPPVGSYTVTPPSLGSVSCTSGYTTCGVEVVASGAATTLSFTAAYPDIAPTTYQFPTQDLSAVPSNATSATYSYSINLGATAYSNAIDGNPGATGDSSASSAVNIYRTSALTLTPTVAGPRTPCTAQITSSCLFMANSANGTGLNDAATYSVAINNAGPDLATNTVLTIPLPTNFLVTANPTVAFNGIATSGVTNQLVCTYQSATNAVVCQGYVPTGASTATLTSKFSTTTVPANAAFTTTATAPNTPGSGSVTASAINANNSTTLPAVTIYRAAQLVAAKIVIPAPGNVSPNGFAVNGVSAVNLDEKTAGDANGKNDTIQITEQVGNAGLNDAVGVVITDTLPAYFILTKLPDPSVATCTVNGATTTDAAGHPMTGATPATLTCTLQNPVPRGTATAGTGGAHGTVSGAFAQVVYYGKFEDNGLQPDAIPLTQSSALVSFGTLKAMSSDEVDLGSGADTTSAPIAPLPVMRAAHLRFTLVQYVQPGDAPLNAVGGVSGPAIAEAQLNTSGGEVVNPARYQVRVTNDGPNIATDPVVNTTLPLNPGGTATKFTHISQSIEPSNIPGFPITPANCATGLACQDGGAIPTGSTMLYNVDGNFDINTLVEGNSGTRIFASSVTSVGIIDSNTAATAGGDQQTSLPITVVNTPVGANIALSPFGGNLSQPLAINLTTVQVAGITSLVPAALPALPSGPSPNPPDNGATKPLYQFGQNSAYYTLGTTAAVPTATANPTTLCLTSIPDTFQKPERVLLWALANAPAGTNFNTVPHYTSNGTAGDITSLVLPQGGGSYTVPVASTSYPPPGAQPQPAEVCGVLNGLASAAAPTTLAILEPVNYAPYIRTQITPANGSQPGKGVTAAAANIDLTLTPQNNYDYNDQDPCYTGDGGKTRSTCNDNVQVTSFLFGGGNLIGAPQQVYRYSYADIQANPKQQFNLPAGQPQIYLVLADQLGAQGYKEMTSGNNTQVCDPGNPSTSYVPSTPTCPLPTPLTATTSGAPAQTTLPLANDTSVEVALLSGSVGFGGSSGLIPLPETPTPEAVAKVTAGQTAGFVWNWLTERPEVQGAGGGAPPTLTLSCVSADGTDLASVGMQCNIPPTYTYSTGTGSSLVITAPPAIYVVTRSNSAVGALREAPLSRDLQIVTAIVFPIGAIPLVLLARRRKALKLSGWIAVLLIASFAGMSLGCGSSSFKNMGGTTTTATPSNTYQFIVTASGTAADGTAINIKSYPFAVTVTAVQ